MTHQLLYKETRQVRNTDGVSQRAVSKFVGSFRRIKLFGKFSQNTYRIFESNIHKNSFPRTSCSAVFQQGSFTVEKEREKERMVELRIVGIIEREETLIA